MSNMLTRAEERTYRFIRLFYKENQFSPTVREIADDAGIKSKGVIYRYLLSLQSYGLIELVSGKHRNIVLIEPADDTRLVSVSLQGNIAAGQPIEAIVNCEKVEIPWLAHSQSYALRVQGDSMTEDGIFHGDIVICKQVEHADNGAVVVALVDGEAVTLKRVFFHQSRVELRPANSQYDSQWFDVDRVVIQGVLLGLIREY